jgi:hypothetical protein
MIEFRNEEFDRAEIEGVRFDRVKIQRRRVKLNLARWNIFWR